MSAKRWATRIGTLCWSRRIAGAAGLRAGCNGDPAERAEERTLEGDSKMDTCTTIVMDSTDVATALATGELPAPTAAEPDTASAPDPAPIAPGMAIETTVKNLRAALMATGKVVASRCSIPILECVRIEAANHFGNDYVSMSGTDIDAVLTVALDADVYTAGDVILPLKPLKKALVRRKAAEPVTIEATVSDDAERTPGARVMVGETEFSMTAFALDVWPVPAPALEPECAAIPAKALAGAIADVAAAQSSEEVRYYLNGVLFERTADGASLRLAATDGHRLHIHNTGCHWPAMGVQATDTKSGETSRDPRAIVPRLAIGVLQYLLKGATADAEILVSSDGTRMEFEADNWTLRTKLIDGTYPDFDRIVSSAFPTLAGDKAELGVSATLDTMRAIKAAAADKSACARINFEAGEITGGSIDTGNHSRHALVRVNGECGVAKIGVNASYFADVAERFADAEDATMQLTMNGAVNTIGITAGCKPNFTALVMQLKI